MPEDGDGRIEYRPRSGQQFDYVVVGVRRVVFQRRDAEVNTADDFFERQPVSDGRHPKAVGFSGNLALQIPGQRSVNLDERRALIFHSSHVIARLFFGVNFQKGIAPERHQALEDVAAGEITRNGKTGRFAAISQGVDDVESAARVAHRSDAVSDQRVFGDLLICPGGVRVRIRQAGNGVASAAVNSHDVCRNRATVFRADPADASAFDQHRSFVAEFACLEVEHAHAADEQRRRRRARQRQPQRNFRHLTGLNLFAPDVRAFGINDGGGIRREGERTSAFGAEAMERLILQHARAHRRKPDFAVAAKGQPFAVG
ncbi:MAG: hypothetical protein JMDDDDMK_03823 [Acidobacteria bacterium]|nr:hypothetical protein [Acidobacteriota bacterium]